MLVGSRSEIGHVRKRNEDALLVAPEAGVFAVADGLGGHPAGDVASALAADTLRAALAAPAMAQADEPGRLLLGAVLGAHEAILTAAEGDLGRLGMATTVVIAGVRGETVWVVHVGDSRAYLFEPTGSLRVLTRDHGEGGYLTQALGLEGGVEPDRTTLELPPGSRLLLCSDGLTNMVDDDEIAELLAAEREPQRACDALVTAALDAGGVDNVTVILVDAPSE